MRYKTILVALLIPAAVVLCFYPPGANAEDKDANLLQGKWMQQSREVDGRQLDDPAGVYLLVTDDGMMQTWSPVGSTEGPGPTCVRNVYYRLDATKDPVTIDTTGKPDWSDVSKGICRLENDSLIVCFAPKNKPRPTKFSTGAGTGQVLIVYKRDAER